MLIDHVNRGSSDSAAVQPHVCCPQLFSSTYTDGLCSCSGLLSLPLTSSFSFLSFAPAPSVYFPPLNVVPSCNVPLCLLSLYLLFYSIVFTPSLPPALPPFSRSLPAMQTLKVNLHSKVLLLARATVTERFSSCASSVLLPFFCPFFYLTSYRSYPLCSKIHLRFHWLRKVQTTENDFSKIT